MPTERGFDYEPDPAFDGLSECIRAGWMYPHEIEKKEMYPIENAGKTLEIAEARLKSGQAVGAYVLDIGIVHDVSRDADGNTMVLTSLDRVDRIPPRNPYTDADRIL